MKCFLRLLFFVVVVFYANISFAYDYDAEFGLAVSYYKYEEPGAMDSNGAKLGVDYIGTLFFDNDFFTRGNIIGAYGKVDYSSPRSGTKKGEPDWYIDARVLFGNKLRFDGFNFSPYTGFGYRYLYNDARGISSVGHAGYRRESNYLYLPIGAEFEREFAGRSKFITGLEFDYLLVGKQKSYLSSDTDNLLDRDIKNIQRSGYGLRFNFRYCLDDFSVGPYINYWYIPCSDGVWAYQAHGEKWSVWVEPKNYTFELGVRVSYRL